LALENAFQLVHGKHLLPLVLDFFLDFQQEQAVAAVKDFEGQFQVEMGDSVEVEWQQEVLEDW
jgi:hypothetical protein